MKCHRRFRFAGRYQRSRWWQVAALGFVASLYPAAAQEHKPIYRYLNDSSTRSDPNVNVTGPVRLISLNGRKGLNLTSIHSLLELKQHTLNKRQGTVSLWFMPLEDLSAFDPKTGMSTSNKNWMTLPLLSDSNNPQDFDGGNFKLIWTPRWHPSLITMFAKGSFYQQAFDMPHAALISVSHLTFAKNTWYELTLSWDYDHDVYNLYLNGILIGRQDQFWAGAFRKDSAGASLYTGNPDLAMSTIDFYDSALSAQEVYKDFRRDATSFDQKLEDELVATYDGSGRGDFSWSLDASWHNELSLAFDKPSDLNNFYVQGEPVAVKVDDQGLLIETVDSPYTEKQLDHQVYVWSNKTFEGDLYVEYEFKVLRPGGLSLLMVQASGMNREDFMADYPLRTSGRMKTVYGEDIRNYHWEYYREMSDMRNDVSNSALVKNPFAYPLSFSALTTPVEKNVWHKLQFLQVGNKLTGAIDGKIMVEFTDDGFKNNGPVYDFGHIAIRCMLHSKMEFRNLKVYDRKPFAVEELPK